MKYLAFHRLLMIMLLGVVVLFSACSNSESIELTDMTLKDLNGNAVNMADYEGQRVVLNFWASWCGPCLREMPSLEVARQQLDDYAVVLVSDEPLETIQAFAAKKNYQFTYLKLEESIKTMGIFSIPQTYILNRQGEVVHAIDGSTDWASPETLSMLSSVE